MRKIVFRQQARRELDEAGDWYEQERTGLGLDSSRKSNACCIVLAAIPNNFPFCFAMHVRLSHADFLTAFISAREISIS